MTGSTISTSVNQSVTLGSGTYPSPLTITSTGNVAPAVYGAGGVYGSISSDDLINFGGISGALGGKYAWSGTGGFGVSLAGGTLSNTGSIVGGAGSLGGAGVSLSAGALGRNTGEITGGNAGLQSEYSDGGAGVALASGASLLNTGTITGGTGPSTASLGDTTAGPGGAGVTVSDATLTNEATILGGDGGSGGTSSFGGPAGDGVDLIGGSLNNSGTLEGGYGGFGGASATGGTGARLAAGASGTNTGELIGGDGGFGGFHRYGGGGYGGAGGFGLNLDGGTLTNLGTIIGGNGGGANGSYKGGGGAGALISGGVLIDTGTISGGIAGGGGSPADAVYFSAEAGTQSAGTLVIVPTTVFDGLVVADSAFADVLELGSAAVAGTLVGLGTEFMNFQVLSIAAEAVWTITDGFAGAGGVQLGAGAELTSDGTLIGNQGLYGTAARLAGNGAAGINITSNGTLINNGSITGGKGGGSYGSGNGGGGGNGAAVSAGTLINNATISGAPGSLPSGTGKYGVGGAGVSLSGTGMLVNEGLIMAPTQYPVWAGPRAAGVEISGGVLLNQGTILAGGGGGNNGLAGIGMVMLAGSATNDGLILAGTNHYGSGGAGLELTGGILTNNATISGGNGNTGGAGGYVGSGATLFNNGLMAAGTAGVGGDGVDIHGGYVLNTGSIAGARYSGAGVDLASGALTNAGTISGGEGGEFSGNGIGVIAASGAFTNSKLIEGGAGGVQLASFPSGGFYRRGNTGGIGLDMTANVTVANSGTIQGGAGGGTYGSTFYGYYGGAGVVLNAGTVITSGTIEGGTGSADAFGHGAAGDAMTFTGAGELLVDPGAVFIGDVVAGTTVADTMAFGGTARGTLDGIGTQFVNFTDFSFETGASWDVSGTYTAFDGHETVAGFGSGDTIILDGFAANMSEITYVSGIGLELKSTGGTSITLDITGDFTTTDFRVTDAASETTIALESTAPCFAAGTRIATPRGDTAVETLKIGDSVRTASGVTQKIKWIGRRSYDGRFIAGNHLMLPVRIKRNAIAENIPSRDLLVSPGHAICIDDVLVPAWRLINGVSITQAERVESVTYFHIELPGHNVIFAEGCPAESFFNDDKYNHRDRFQNVAEYHELYPVGTDASAMCLTRVESGFHLREIQGGINARAGVAEQPETIGELRGYVEQAGAGGVVSGWAQNVALPETPVRLDIVVNGHIYHVLANGYRGDLRAAGLGSGTHGFELILPHDIVNPAVEVLRYIDQTALAFTDCAHKDCRHVGLEPAAPSRTEAARRYLGPLRGYVETTGPLVSGWAQDEKKPETPVCLDVLVNGRQMARVLADQFRADLRTAGLGSGCHGFELCLPHSVGGYVEVRRSSDGVTLEYANAVGIRAA